MNPIQEIEVDTKIAFSLPSLLDIELVGLDKRVQEFMIELEKSSAKKYFAHFKMYLSDDLEDADINEDFKCKWRQLETALYKAIGKEQNITRLSNFFDKELIIDQMDYHENLVLGKPNTVFKD